MTDDEIQKLPNTSHLMSKEEFAAWIAGRKEAGAKIDIGTAELEGWRAPEGDPYAFSYWAPKGVDRNTDGSPELCPYFFVRDPESRGWVWQDDLPDDKRATMQARIDEHNRKAKEFRANRRAAGRLIDIETCEGFSMKADGIDPYGVELAPYGCIGTTRFVCNKDSGGPIYVGDLPEEKRQALDERAKRERLARKHIIDGLFDALRQGGGGLAAAESAITEAEQIHGERIVEAALQDYNYPCGAIGGHMIERGYLTMEHVTELLRGDPKGPPDIFGS